MSSDVRYTEEISRLKPSVIFFLVDQSGSMTDPFGGMLEGVTNPSKAQGAADALNRCISNIVIRCTKEEGIRDYFHVGVIGYGATVGPALGGPLSGSDLVPVSELGATPLRIEDRVQMVSDRAGGLVETSIKFQVWVDPTGDGRTPMCEALQACKVVLERWVTDHPDSYPPTVINITDGASTDGDPRSPAEDLARLSNTNGSSLLLFNIHLCDSRVPSVLYPSDDGGLTDSYAKQLFEMSSLLPAKLVSEAAAGGLPVVEGARGFVFNAGLENLIQFLDIGTRVVGMADVRPGR
ncbi:MAG TPA: vWA domain-containing protein [Anaerolineae bacterium]|nr:vWA domain-containing protein [Anaerolineae bacterium]